jgi:hypothetical protein
MPMSFSLVSVVPRPATATLKVDKEKVAGRTWCRRQWLPPQQLLDTSWILGIGSKNAKRKAENVRSSQKKSS